MNPKNVFFNLTFMCVAAMLAACASNPATTASTTAPQSVGTAEVKASPTSAILLTATPIPGLLPADVFAQDSDFCLPEVAGSSFELTCNQGSLSVVQVEDRIKVDALLMRGQAVNAEQFNLEADITSLAAEGVKSDQNAYGFYFLDEDGFYKAVHIRGQYFNFETWNSSAEPDVETQLSPAFSADIKSAGQENHWQLACTQAGCELYVNENLAGRFQIGISGSVQTAGIFSTSAWDEDFGQVNFRSLTLSDLDVAMPSFETYILKDGLHSNQGTFTSTGMSGAFNTYDEAGFHFSPVIPYGYYGAKAGPALQDVDISAAVSMEINPDQPGSQYAGLVCRSSQNGMYMAVIGVDGSYTIYRDTPQKPFALLTERKSDAILTGRVENNLRLVCSGNELSFYINGQLVESLTDTRYQLNYGRAGIYTKAGGEPDEDAIIFSDLVIRELN